MKIKGSNILITGGGSGIGRQLARSFQAHGAKVIVAGRRRDALEETIGARPSMHLAVVDVNDAAAISDFAERVTREHPDLNILVNNAGIMREEDLASGGSLGKSEATITTNLLAPIRLIHALLPHLMQQTAPAIVNVTSGLAFVPLVRTPTYSATKAALHSYTVALRAQLEGKGVEVLEIIPPGVQTELTPGQSAREGYMPLDDFIKETMGLLLEKPPHEEIGVARVNFLRNAEAEGRFASTFETLNGR